MLAKCFFIRKHDVIQLEKIKREYYETIFHYIVFNIYLKASIALEGVFIKTSNPTILKDIPLGSQNKTIPVDHVASVDSSFRLDFKSFAWGIIFALIGLSMMQHSFIGGLILAAYDVLTVLSAFQTLLVLYLTSGGTHVVSVVVFEKANLENCKETIEGLIHNRYNDTNVTKNTDRIIDALKNK